MNSLPTQPSALIRAGIEDARKLDSGAYLPEAGVWHSPRSETGEDGIYAQTHCEVCFAGAVMAARFGVPRTRYMNGPRDEWGPDTAPTNPALDVPALLALNRFREGGWFTGLDILGIEWSAAPGGGPGADAAAAGAEFPGLAGVRAVPRQHGGHRPALRGDRPVEAPALDPRSGPPGDAAQGAGFPLWMDCG